MPTTVLVEEYWREISTGLAHHAIPVRHFVLHADQDTRRGHIDRDTLLGPSPFRLKYLESYAEAARTWLHDEAEVIGTRARVACPNAWVSANRLPLRCVIGAQLASREKGDAASGG